MSILFKVKQILISMSITFVGNLVGLVDFVKRSFPIPFLVYRFSWIRSESLLVMRFFYSLGRFMRLVLFVLIKFIRLWMFSFLLQVWNINEGRLELFIFQRLGWFHAAWLLFERHFAAVSDAFIFYENIVVFEDVWIESVFYSILRSTF